MEDGKNGKFYVYELIDPRCGTVFYVGKGTGSRIGAHEREAAAGVSSDKCNKIREIADNGYKVKKKKVAHFHDEIQAYAYEANLIAKHGIDSLTNVSAGCKTFNRRQKEIKQKRRQSISSRFNLKNIPYLYRKFSFDLTPEQALNIVSENKRFFVDYLTVSGFGKYSVTAEFVSDNSTLYALCKEYAVLVLNHAIKIWNKACQTDGGQAVAIKALA